MSQVLKERLVKHARKRHYCDWCNELIPIGSSYLYFVAVNDGDFSPYGYHAECWRALGTIPSDDLESVTCGEGARGKPYMK